jgi:hypothetical protein
MLSAVSRPGSLAYQTHTTLAPRRGPMVPGGIHPAVPYEKGSAHADFLVGEAELYRGQQVGYIRPDGGRTQPVSEVYLNVGAVHTTLLQQSCVSRSKSLPQSGLVNISYLFLHFVRTSSTPSSSTTSRPTSEKNGVRPPRPGPRRTAAWPLFYIGRRYARFLFSRAWALHFHKFRHI